MDDVKRQLREQRERLEQEAAASQQAVDDLRQRLEQVEQTQAILFSQTESLRSGLRALELHQATIVATVDEGLTDVAHDDPAALVTVARVEEEAEAEEEKAGATLQPSPRRGPPLLGGPSHGSAHGPCAAASTGHPVLTRQAFDDLKARVEHWGSLGAHPRLHTRPGAAARGPPDEARRPW